MYDLHAHILPGVDDGAKTREDAITMARVAADHGTKVILATPHRRDITEHWSVPHVVQLEVDDRADVVLLQRVEDDGLVDAVEELGAEDPLHLLRDLVLHPCVPLLDGLRVVGRGVEAEPGVLADQV
ncbi:MAG: hypothetical protein IH991_25260, partial [Planctomycetes bacterium]|nr:hypothetical protein [Planctomycetota bacterium]